MITDSRIDILAQQVKRLKDALEEVRSGCDYWNDCAELCMGDLDFVERIIGDAVADVEALERRAERLARSEQ